MKPKSAPSNKSYTRRETERTHTGWGDLPRWYEDLVAVDHWWMLPSLSDRTSSAHGRRRQGRWRASRPTWGIGGWIKRRNFVRIPTKRIWICKKCVYWYDGIFQRLLEQIEIIYGDTEPYVQKTDVALLAVWGTIFDEICGHISPDSMYGAPSGSLHST